MVEGTSRLLSLGCAMIFVFFSLFSVFLSLHFPRHLPRFLIGVRLVSFSICREQIFAILLSLFLIVFEKSSFFMKTFDVCVLPENVIPISLLT